jgi:membrane fusion protein (multidrug efflux system)
MAGNGMDNHANTAAPAAPTRPANTAGPQTPAAPQDANGNGKTERTSRPWVKPLVLAGILIVLVVGGSWVWNYLAFARTHASTDDAYLTTDIVQITPQVIGNITQVLVKENQTVQAGQLLVTLDDSTYRTAVAQARADLAQAQAAAQGASSNVGLTAQTGSAQIEQAQGIVGQADSAISGAQADVERARAGIANAQAGVAGAQANVQTAQAGVQAAIAARQRTGAAVSSAQAQLATAQAAVKSAQAAVVAAQANADKTARDEVRYANLYNQDAVSAQQLDLATATATTAKAQLDSTQQQVVQAQATVAQRQADLKSAQDAVRNADAMVAQARSQLHAANQGVNAAQATVRQNQAQFTSVQQSVSQAEAKRTQALGQLNQAQTAPKQVAVSRANQQNANAKIAQARAALDNAEINLQRTRIYAPVQGTISKKTAELGQQVAVGQSLMAVIPTNDVWVVANFKETQMQDVRPGQKVEVEVDTFSGHKFTGRVDSIAPATGATFSLLPPDNATGNFTKVVQRVPVKITFDPGQKDLNLLRGGLSAVATIATK